MALPRITQTKTWKLSLILLLASYSTFIPSGLVGASLHETVPHYPHHYIDLSLYYVSFLSLKDFIYLFLERGEGREKERERNMCERNINQLPLTRPQLGTWRATQACALTGNQTGDLLVCRLVLDPLSHTNQGCL